MAHQYPDTKPQNPLMSIRVFLANRNLIPVTVSRYCVMLRYVTVEKCKRRKMTDTTECQNGVSQLQGNTEKNKSCPSSDSENKNLSNSSGNAAQNKQSLVANAQQKHGQGNGMNKAAKEAMEISTSAEPQDNASPQKSVEKASDGSSPSGAEQGGQSRNARKKAAKKARQKEQELAAELRGDKSSTKIFEEAMEISNSVEPQDNSSPHKSTEKASDGSSPSGVEQVGLSKSARKKAAKKAREEQELASEQRGDKSCNKIVEEAGRSEDPPAELEFLSQKEIKRLAKLQTGGSPAGTGQQASPDKNKSVAEAVQSSSDSPEQQRKQGKISLKRPTEGSTVNAQSQGSSQNQKSERKPVQGPANAEQQGDPHKKKRSKASRKAARKAHEANAAPVREPVYEGAVGGAVGGARARVALNYRVVKGDLFSCGDNVSLAHCVSEDLHMGKGIAVKFKNLFGRVGRLMSQEKRVGEVATLQMNTRFVYYLVTKRKYHQKPNYDTLRSSLEAMQAHCAVNHVADLAMPMIGCGLDGLDWGYVSEMIQEVFKDLDMNITVYYI